MSLHMQFELSQQTYYIKVLLPTDAQENAVKGVLKFTLKMIQHVLV